MVVFSFLMWNGPSTIIEMQQHLNKVNNRIHVKITCRVFDPSLNNKTTVTYIMMQTTQKDSFFKIIILIY